LWQNEKCFPAHGSRAPRFSFLLPHMEFLLFLHNKN
jgi:hypothetical protein